MSARDVYIVHHRSRASAWRDAASYVPADCQRAGVSVRETFESYARAEDEQADYAKTLSGGDFRAYVS